MSAEEWLKSDLGSTVPMSTLETKGKEKTSFHMLINLEPGTPGLNLQFEKEEQALSTSSSGRTYSFGAKYAGSIATSAHKSKAKPSSSRRHHTEIFLWASLDRSKRLQRLQSRGIFDKAVSPSRFLSLNNTRSFLESASHKNQSSIPAENIFNQAESHPDQFDTVLKHTSNTITDLEIRHAINSSNEQSHAKEALASTLDTQRSPSPTERQRNSLSDTAPTSPISSVESYDHIAYETEAVTGSNNFSPTSFSIEDEIKVARASLGMSDQNEFDSVPKSSQTGDVVIETKNRKSDAGETEEHRVGMKKVEDEYIETTLKKRLHLENLLHEDNKNLESSAMTEEVEDIENAVSSSSESKSQEQMRDSMESQEAKDPALLREIEMLEGLVKSAEEAANDKGKLIEYSRKLEQHIDRLEALAEQ